MQGQKKETGIHHEIEFSEEQEFRHKTLEERAMAYDGKLNLDGEYDWGVPVGREIWYE